jgi:hypothetical protein
MKLRITNKNDYAVEFIANSLNEFHDTVKQACATFRKHECRLVHRGEICKTVMWSCAGYLNVFDERSGNWYNPGQVKCTKTGIEFFEPYEAPLLPWREDGTIESILLQDEFSISATCAQLWSICVDAWKWNMALGNQITEVTDSLPNNM